MPCLFPDLFCNHCYHHLHGLWKWPQTCSVLVSPNKNIHLRCPVTAVLSPFLQSDDCPGLDHSSVTLAGFGLVSGHHENRRVSTLSEELDMNSFFHLSWRAYECEEGEQPEDGLIHEGRIHGDVWGDQMSSQYILVPVDTKDLEKSKITLK